jgi:CBS domain-containing protein
MRYPVTVPRGVAWASPRWMPGLNPMVPRVHRPKARVAADVMTGDPEPVACSDTLVEVAGRMRSLLVAFLPVCDQNGDLHGIISLRDVHRALRGRNPTQTTAASLAQAPPVTIGVDDPVDHVWDLMAEQKMWLLPVLDGRQLVGVIH